MSKSTTDISDICYFRYAVTYANDFNRQTHIHTHTDKLIVTGEILQICPIESNLPGTSAVFAHFKNGNSLTRTTTLDMAPFDNESQSDLLQSICSGAIRWKISESIRVTHFASALTVSEILSFQIFEIENSGEAHGVQHSP